MFATFSSKKAALEFARTAMRRVPTVKKGSVTERVMFDEAPTASALSKLKLPSNCAAFGLASSVRNT